MSAKRAARALPVSAGLVGAIMCADYYALALPQAALAACYCAWLACYMLDARLTVKSPSMMQYESSLTFCALHARIGRPAVAAHALVDLGLAAALSLILTGSISHGPVAIACAAMGAMHLHAYMSNRRLLQSRQLP